MTKLRSPDSVEEAVRHAGALLGNGVISIALTSPTLGVSVSESLVVKWGDPEAPQRIGLHQALAVERLLIGTGHSPVFVDLFTRLQPAEPEAEAELPVVAAMRAVSEAADVMDLIDAAMSDGELSAAELIACRAAVEKLQKRCARLRRTLFSKPPKTSAR